VSRRALIKVDIFTLGNICLLLGWSITAHAGDDLPTKFSNQGGIINTRHNLTQNSDTGNIGGTMDPYRNNYGEVCVYCHTPHGANEQVEAPLWNRTLSSASYTTYDQLGSSTITSTITAPGPSSVTCLSCHDGTLAVDSIVNMPGSGNYSAAQKTSQSNTFLNSWTNDGNDATQHLGLNQSGCLDCHSPDGGAAGAFATDFTAFAIGTDLTNDHPVGILFPGVNENFNAPDFSNPSMAAYDSDFNGKISKGDIRFYDSGEGYEVECASCHDPHGVPSAGQGSIIYPTFLRINNEGSTVCLTCHNK